jgi:hypothetical protein
LDVEQEIVAIAGRVLDLRVRARSRAGLVTPRLGR